MAWFPSHLISILKCEGRYVISFYSSHRIFDSVLVRSPLVRIPLLQSSHWSSKSLIFWSFQFLKGCGASACPFPLFAMANLIACAIISICESIGSPLPGCHPGLPPPPPPPLPSDPSTLSSEWLLFRGWGGSWFPPHWFASLGGAPSCWLSSSCLPCSLVFCFCLSWAHRYTPSGVVAIRRAAESCVGSWAWVVVVRVGWRLATFGIIIAVWTDNSSVICFRASAFS